MRTSDHSLGFKMQHELPQEVCKELPHELRGVLPVLPVAYDVMSEPERKALEALVQETRTKHQAARVIELKPVQEVQATAPIALPVAGLVALPLALFVPSPVPSPVQPIAVPATPSVSPSDFKRMQEQAAQQNAKNAIAEALEQEVQELTHKMHTGANPVMFPQRHSTAVIELATKRYACTTPTLQQAYTKRRNQDREANKELGKALKANNAGIQHSVKDYALVICTQLDLQYQGENPCATEVLRKAFPDTPAKAVSIGNSKGMGRVKKAYESDTVQQHPVQQSTLAHYGARVMQQRCSTRTFRQALGLTRTFFKVFQAIAELNHRVTLLEQERSSTQNRAVLHDAKAETTREKVLTLSAQGSNAKEIAEALNMKPSAVRKCLSRAKGAGVH